jgi:hypothetical protein
MSLNLTSRMRHSLGSCQACKSRYDLGFPRSKAVPWRFRGPSARGGAAPRSSGTNSDDILRCSCFLPLAPKAQRRARDVMRRPRRFTFPSPLWGGVRGGGREARRGRRRSYTTSRPPPHPTPQGGGREYAAAAEGKRKVVPAARARPGFAERRRAKQASYVRAGFDPRQIAAAGGAARIRIVPSETKKP